MNRATLWIFNVLLAILIAASLVQAAEPKLKIGFTGVLSGPWAGWGNSSREGFTLASEGAQLEITIDIQDDQCDAKQALSNTQKFLYAGKQIIVAGCMETVDAIAPIAARRGVPVFVLGSVTESLLARNKNVFALGYHAHMGLPTLVAYLKSAGIRSLAVVTGTNINGEEMEQVIQREAKARDLLLVNQKSLPINTSDFRAIFPQLLHRKPEAIFVHQSENTLLSFIRQARESGYNGEIFTILTIECEATKKLMSSQLEGVKYVFPLGALDQERWDDFSRRYQNRYHTEPNANSAIAYDGFHIISAAARTCPSLDLQCLTSFYATEQTFKGPGGTAVLTAARGVVRPYGIKQIHKGEFVWVTKDVPESN